MNRECQCLPKCGICYRKWHKRTKEFGKSYGGIEGKWVIFLTLELAVYWLLGLIFMQILDTKWNQTMTLNGS